MDAKITNSNENKANPVNYSTQGFTGDPDLFQTLLLFHRSVPSAYTNICIIVILNTKVISLFVIHKYNHHKLNSLGYRRRYGYRHGTLPIDFLLRTSAIQTSLIALGLSSGDQ